MRTHTFIIFMAAAPLLGCEEDPINRGRNDAGAPRDSGAKGPLLLEPGMTFTYDAILTFRAQAQGQEENSRYTLTVTIDSVDDQGGEGQSSLAFTATGMRTLSDTWASTTDFDLWIARLGPSHADDVLAGMAVTEDLWDPPVIPPPPSPPPKMLPAPGTFFIDVRQIEQIRADFSMAHQGQRPQSVDPGMSPTETWDFAWSGPDELYFNYPDPTNRDVRLSYDQRGFLVRMDETIGDASNPPSANARLTLTSGP